MKRIIQIAGIKDREEAELLMDCGVDWLAFPFRLSFHKEDLSEVEAARVMQSIRPPHEAVLITYLNRADEISVLSHKLGTRKVQIHGDISLAELRILRTLDPGLFIIKSLIVREKNRSELDAMARQLEAVVDAFITDTYDAQTGAVGATGKTHDWGISRQLVGGSSKPVMLAGGLTPANVALAIKEARPAGVDAHTGVEDYSGRKNKKLVRLFVNEARKAFAEIA